MTRAFNADDFLLVFRRVRGQYENTFSKQLQALREMLASASESGRSKVNPDLEAHVRVYYVNAVLEALNWRMDTQAGDMGPNLVPEAALTSLERGTRRFLDYLGIERETGLPLLVVESKRPSAELPKLRNPSTVYSLPMLVSKGLGGAELAHDWNKWLISIRDYVRSVHAATDRAPLRAIITNGDWYIVFMDPEDSFLERGSCNPANIAVFKGGEISDGQPATPPETESRYREFFDCLEYHKVVANAPPMSPGTLAFNIDGKNVERVMHGLRLRYASVPQPYLSSPNISVAPVIFMKSRFGPWLTLEIPPRYFAIPHDRSQLLHYLGEVDAAAKALLAQMNERLGARFVATTLATHYGDDAEFEKLRAVREVADGAFLIATGDNTHYLLRTPTVPDCPFHEVGNAVAQGVGPDVPNFTRSLEPRSFFFSSEPHYCAHREVFAAKASPITQANKAQCGPRSGEENQAFCEIWRVDQFLCCRTCAFESVCTKAAAFHLPCHLP